MATAVRTSAPPKSSIFAAMPARGESAEIDEAVAVIKRRIATLRCEFLQGPPVRPSVVRGTVYVSDTDVDDDAAVTASAAAQLPSGDDHDDVLAGAALPSKHRSQVWRDVELAPLPLIGSQHNLALHAWAGVLSSVSAIQRFRRGEAPVEALTSGGASAAAAPAVAAGADKDGTRPAAKEKAPSRASASKAAKPVRGGAAAAAASTVAGAASLPTVESASGAVPAGDGTSTAGARPRLTRPRAEDLNVWTVDAPPLSSLLTADSDAAAGDEPEMYAMAHAAMAAAAAYADIVLSSLDVRGGGAAAQLIAAHRDAIESEDGDKDGDKDRADKRDGDGARMDVDDGGAEDAAGADGDGGGGGGGGGGGDGKPDTSPVAVPGYESVGVAREHIKDIAVAHFGRLFRQQVCIVSPSELCRCRSLHDECVARDCRRNGRDTVDLQRPHRAPR
jgi:hypothetical protein